MGGKAGAEKGADLERRFARVEFAEGSLVRVRHPVIHLVDGRRRQVTDVDVLSLDFDTRLRPHLGISECKSARGQTGEQDRLLWLRGLQMMLNADRATLVRETVSIAGRDVARRVKVDLIGRTELALREQAIDHFPANFATIGNTSYFEAHKQADEQLKKIGDVPAGLMAFLRSDAIVSEPYEVLGALITLDEITRRATILPNPLADIFAGHALQALVCAALRAGGRTDVVGTEGTRKEIELGLGTGDPHDRQLYRVAEMADSLLREELSKLHQWYRSKGAPPLERPVPSLRDSITAPPRWLSRFMDLAERLRRRSPIARQLPQTVELLAFDAILGDASWRYPAFDHLFGREHRQMLIMALDCLEDAVPAIAGNLNDLLEIPFDRAPTASLKSSTVGRQQSDVGNKDEEYGDAARSE